MNWTMRESMRLWQMLMTNLTSKKMKGPVSSNLLVSPAPKRLLQSLSSLWPKELARRSTFDTNTIKWTDNKLNYQKN